MRIQDSGFLFKSLNNKSAIFSNMLNTLSNTLTDHSNIKSGNYKKLISAYFEKTRNEKLGKSNNGSKKRRKFTKE